MHRQQVPYYPPHASNVVPNPPQVYAPTVQEQWMMKKQQQQQAPPTTTRQQPVYQSMGSGAAAGVPSLAASAGGHGQRSQSQTRQESGMFTGDKEYVIPITVERSQQRSQESSSRRQQQFCATGFPVQQPPMSCSFPPMMSDPMFSSPFTSTGMNVGMNAGYY